MTRIENFAKALGLGLLAEVVCVWIGFGGAMGAAPVLQLVLAIHAPSIAIKELVRPGDWRGIPYGDIAFVFVVQWIIYTMILFVVLMLRQRRNKRR